jgi:hypothetical protein
LLTVNNAPRAMFASVSRPIVLNRASSKGEADEGPPVMLNS